MNRYAKAIFIIALLLMLCGCSGMDFSSGGFTRYSQTTSAIDDAGNPVTTTLDVEVEQPQNATTPGTISIEPQENGGVTVHTDTGQSEAPSAIHKAVGLGKMLNPVVWIGAAMMAASALVFIIGDKKWGLTIFGCGAAMALLAYLFAQYSPLFLILVVGIIGWMLYNLVKNKTLFKSNVETMSLVEILKGKLKKHSPEDYKEIFEGTEVSAPIVRTVQSPSTVKLFKQIKEHEFRK